MKKKLLLIDDDISILGALKSAFEDEGYDVEASSDGSPIENINHQSPDIVIIDIMLAGEDGRKLAHKIKTKKNIPIIMISAMADARTSAMQSGADVFFPKPFDLDELLDTAEIICNSRG